MKLVLATGNKGKIREFQVAFGHRGIECIGIKDVCDVPEPEETGTSFMENAILKATYYMQACGLPCIADDSGLAVDALNGEPGIYSARYAGHDGEHGDDDANNKKLVANLQGIPFEGRTAHYVAALALAVPNQYVSEFTTNTLEESKNATAGVEQASVDAENIVRGVKHADRIIVDKKLDAVIFTSQGTCDGLIQDKPVGDGGFGYDPYFYVPDFQKTMAQLDIDTKESISHRGRAITLLLDTLS